MIANQPTRGVDVGAIEFLHQRLVAERDNGTAVLIVSTELDEVVALADRIAVMYRGRIVGIVPADTSREVLGLMMAGVPSEEALANASVTTQAEEDAAWRRHPRSAMSPEPPIAPSRSKVEDGSHVRPPRRTRAATARTGAAAASHQPAKAKRRSFPWSDLVTTLAAFVLAFFVGALLMIFSDTEVRQTFTYFFARPATRWPPRRRRWAARTPRCSRARWAATARSPRPRPRPPR